MDNFMFAWAQSQIPSLYIRQGPATCVVVYLAVLLWIPAIKVPMLLWLGVEILWLAYFTCYLLPQLTSFRPEDSCKPLLAEDVNRLIDNIVFLIRKDRHTFWSHVTGKACSTGSIPASTARCFVKSLMFFYDECHHYTTPEQTELYENAVTRVKEACGGFAEENVDDISNHIPNHIRSWVDDDHLGDLVRCTPLVMILVTEAVRAFTLVVVLIFGFRRGHVHSPSGVECWVWDPPTLAAESRPLVLLPGAGFGLTSFLPLALLLQNRLPNRRIILYRLPWVEMCRPWVVLPQWSSVITGLKEGFKVVGLNDCEIDVLGHSYGTAVANRLLRELCTSGSEVFNEEQEVPPRIHFLGLLDPIVLGGASTGLSGFTINQVGPDLSFAFCGNRAGNGTKEILDYDPCINNQCMGGISVYMSAHDQLVDVDLARHILVKDVIPLDSPRSSHVQLCVDRTEDSFHGRWLVEIWCGGLLWGAPCATNCLNLLSSRLGMTSHSGDCGVKATVCYDVITSPIENENDTEK
jgi:hypothetical protein